MTEVAKRRIELLRETRKTYSEKYSPPAIHPRYQSTYQSLYGQRNDVVQVKSGTFLLRLVISLFIFALFFVMTYQKQEFGAVNSQAIIHEIQKSFSK